LIGNGGTGDSFGRVVSVIDAVDNAGADGQIAGVVHPWTTKLMC
jgi:hypothetical protein